MMRAKGAVLRGLSSRCEGGNVYIPDKALQTRKMRAYGVREAAWSPVGTTIWTPAKESGGRRSRFGRQAMSNRGGDGRLEGLVNDVALLRVDALAFGKG
jgi:hypothetical protein